MTLAQLQALADDKLIELVATKVMNWEAYPKWPAQWKKSETEWIGKNWNPLADWNHTMEVWNTIKQQGMASKEWFGFLDALKQITGIGHFEQMLAMIDQRAILLAALLACQ